MKKPFGGREPELRGLRKGTGIRGFSILMLRISEGRTLLRVCGEMMVYGMTRQKALKIRWWIISGAFSGHKVFSLMSYMR